MIEINDDCGLAPDFFAVRPDALGSRPGQPARRIAS
jgi:hypothetical protein